MFQEDIYRSYKKRLKIDTLRLDDELIEHPSLLQSVIECAADALQVRDAADAALKIEQTEAMIRIRESVEEKLSDVRVSALVLLDEQVQAAMEVIEEAKHDLAYWQGLAESFRAKGSSLKRIAELTIAGFLAPNAAYKERQAEMASKRVPLRPREA